MVSSWLINAMTPQLKKSFMYLPSAYEIWVAVHDSYVDSKDLSHIFDIQRRIWKSFQGSRGVTEYWLELNGLWQELDLLNQEEWKCSTDAALMKKNIAIEGSSILAGLKLAFKDVQSKILN